MEVARADPTPGAAGRSVRFAHLPRLRSSGLAQSGHATNRPTVKLDGGNDSGGGPLPSIKVGRSGALAPSRCRRTRRRNTGGRLAHESANLTEESPARP